MPGKVDRTKPSVRFMRKHQITHYAKHLKEGRLAHWKLFFEDRKWVLVYICTSRYVGHLEEPGTEGFFMPAGKDEIELEDGNFIGYIILSNRWCDELLVSHEVVHAVCAWLKGKKVDGRKFMAVKSGDDPNHPAELLAENVGQLIRQFWKCFEVAFPGKRKPIWNQW